MRIKLGANMKERDVFPLLRVADLKAPDSLVQKVRYAQDPLSRYIRDQFSPNKDQLLNDYDDKSSPSEDLKAAMVDTLNRVIQGGVCLYDEDRFSCVKLRKACQRMIKQDLQGEYLNRLNRLLLEDAYPEALARNRFPAFLDTNQRSSLRGDVEDIAKYLIERKLLFLCGAGLSSRSRVPLFRELSKIFIEDILKVKDDNLVNSLSDSFSGESLAGAYMMEKGPAKLRNVLIDLYDRPDQQGHVGHKVLKHFASEGFFNTIYTTNFDTLLSEEFGRMAVEIVNENVTDTAEHLAKGKIAVIHLHGKIEKAQAYNIAITEQQTHTYETPVSYLLRADLLKNWFVFLGYNMTDMDFRGVYFLIQKMLDTFGQGKKTYVVLKFDDDQLNEWGLAEKVWAQRQAKLLPMTCENFLEELRDKVENIIMEGWISKLADKLDEGEETIWVRIERRLLKQPGLKKLEALKTIADFEGIDLYE